MSMAWLGLWEAPLAGKLLRTRIGSHMERVDLRVEKKRSWLWTLNWCLANVWRGFSGLKTLERLPRRTVPTQW